MSPPSPPPADPLAHLTADGRPHLLIDHLVSVGDGAASFAEAFGKRWRSRSWSTSPPASAAPFTTLHAASIDGVFTDAAEVDELVSILATFAPPSTPGSKRAS